MDLEKRRFLLALAHRAIAVYPGIPDGNRPTWTEIKLGVFVSVYVSEELRGCIGNIIPQKGLFETVIELAVHAAFEDHRFSPVITAEFSSMKIEISLLSIPQIIEYKEANDLKIKLAATKPGVIVTKGFKTATFLPQVWEQLPDPEEFLAELCVKAGMSPFEWKANGLVIQTYTVEHFRG